MNYLARLEVDAQIAFDRKVFDNYGWHQRIWEDCFNREPNSKRDFLTRIDTLERGYRIWILTNRQPIRPDWCIPDCFASKKISPSFLSYRYYAFDLRANPTKCVAQTNPEGNKIFRRDERRTKGKRIPIVKLDELRAWILRKAQVRCLDKAGGDVPGGFRILQEHPLEISPMVEYHFRRKKGETAYHGGVQFRGVLEVMDRKRFVESYQYGIGGAKGFGFGLLLLAPIQIENQESNINGGNK